MLNDIPAPNVLENPPIILSSTFQKIAYYSFLIPVPIILILFFLPLFLQVIAEDNTYILAAQNEARHHRHNYNHNNTSYL